MNTAQPSAGNDLQVSAPEAEQTTLTCWLGLSLAEKAFVTAYIENSYSLRDAAAELAITPNAAGKYLQQPRIKSAVAEVQSQLSDIDFLNEKYVRAQLLKLYPKFIGEEDVPFITNTGEQGEGRKFYPEAALKVLEYIAPKKVTPAITINMGNIHKLTDQQLEEIAFRGRVIDV